MKHKINDLVVLVEVTPSGDDITSVAHAYPIVLRDYLDSFFFERAVIGNMSITVRSGDYYTSKDFSGNTDIEDLEFDSVIIEEIYIFSIDGAEEKEIEITDTISELLVEYFSLEIKEAVEESIYEAHLKWVYE